MSGRDRTWLRSFLHLDARHVMDDIPIREIERQEDTVLRALQLLDTQPGCVLADEVGMGKTYEALGVLAAFMHDRADARAVILTPGPDLNTKWKKELAQFGEATSKLYDFGDTFEAVDDPGALAKALSSSEKRIIIAPTTIFHAGRGIGDQSDLLTWFCRYADLPAQTSAALFKRALGGKLSKSDRAVPADLESSLGAMFRRGVKDRDLPAGLFDLWETGGLSAFDHEEPVRRALDLARFRRIRARMPTVDLLIVDEAHKLKSEGTVRSTAIHAIFRRRFRKALFLSATPFQLDIGELQSLFRLFAVAKDGPADVTERAEKLFADIREYQGAYADFENAWQRLDSVAAVAFAELFKSDPRLDAPIDDPTLRRVGEAVRRLARLKDECIEPGFRAWMIRSLREDKRVYRSHAPQRLGPRGAGMIPFVLYERFIAELFRQHERTYKAAVEINLVSSFGAAREGALLADGEEGPKKRATDVLAYRNLLRDVIGELRGHSASHPKLTFVVDDAIRAAARGEKTLVFCARTETLRELRTTIQNAWLDQILARWRVAYPGVADGDVFDKAKDESRQKGHHSHWRDRFQRATGVLYLALRERYSQTLLQMGEWAEDHAEEIAERANEVIATLRVPKPSAERVDYRLAKRAVEHAAACLFPDAESVDARAAVVLRDPKFVSLGLDLVKDALEGDEEGDQVPEWSVDAEMVKSIVGNRPSLWKFLANELAKEDAIKQRGLPYDLRVELTERLATWLTRKEVTFIADVLGAARKHGIDLDAVSGREMLAFVDTFWTRAEGREWVQRIREFVGYFLSRTPIEQRGIVEDSLTTGQFVRETTEGVSRERLRAAFNTTLYPMILLANEVMQEGLDLHRNCRRIVHHDLAWNPAQLEQRVGRIDRLGSLVHRLRARPSTSGATIDILYPLVERTIDERLYRTVKDREKWLELMLGARPTLAEDPAGEPPPPLPSEIAERLRVDLTPRGGE